MAAKVTHKTIKKHDDGLGGFVGDLHYPSVMVGVAGTLVVVLVLSFIKRTGKTLIKIALFAAIACLIAGAYLGWLRSAAGLGDARISTPGEIIDDAQEAADQMKKRIKETERTLEKIEKTAR